MALERRAVLRGAAVAGMAAALPLIGSPGAAGSPRATVPRSAGVALLDLFACSAFNDEALFALGAASSHTAEVGEVLRIAQRITAITGDPADPGIADFDAYVDQFGAYASELLALANSTSRPVTIRNRLLRSSMYAAQQLFFVLGTSDGSRERGLFEHTQSRWLRAMRMLDPATVHARVASPFGPLPVHFLATTVGSGPRPTIIISEGSDGQNVETMQFGVTAGLERGYNVVLFEGPGQMTPLFVRGEPFTADWNLVIDPVLAWTRAQRDVGRVGLIGISFGGMLCARAAARSPGLDAVVLEPAAYDFTTMWDDQESMSLVKETHGSPQQRAAARRELNAGFLQAWPHLSRTDQFTIYKRGSIFDRRVRAEARAGRPPSDYYALLESLLPFRFGRDYEQIRIPTLVTGNEGDEFFGAQPRQAFGRLDSLPSGRKAYLELTAARGASLHDQPVGPQVAEEFVFDWLDEQLR